METHSATTAGTRGDVDVGRKAALKVLPRIRTALEGADLVFILAGMGGGTGGGAAPIAAELARKSGALVVGLVTKPFFPERGKVSAAVDSLRALLKTCDTVVLVENHGAGGASHPLPFRFDLDIAGQTTCSLVSSITQSFHNPSSLSSDIADLREMLRQGGLAKAGVSGWCSGGGLEEAALTVMRDIVSHCDLTNTDGVFLGILSNGGVHESDLASILELVSRRINPDADFLYAHHAEPEELGLTRLSLLATGISFPYSWGGYRRVPIEIFEMEPESGDDGSLSIRLEIPQLEA
jgi:cell division protein FtsZ